MEKHTKYIKTSLITLIALAMIMQSASAEIDYKSPNEFNMSFNSNTHEFTLNAPSFSTSFKLGVTYKGNELTSKQAIGYINKKHPNIKFRKVLDKMSPTATEWGWAFDKLEQYGEAKNVDSLEFYITNSNGISWKDVTMTREFDMESMTINYILHFPDNIEMKFLSGCQIEKVSNTHFRIFGNPEICGDPITYSSNIITISNSTGEYDSWSTCATPQDISDDTDVPASAFYNVETTGSNNTWVLNQSKIIIDPYTYVCFDYSSLIADNDDETINVKLIDNYGYFRFNNSAYTIESETRNTKTLFAIFSQTGAYTYISDSYIMFNTQSGDKGGIGLNFGQGTNQVNNTEIIGSVVGLTTYQGDVTIKGLIIKDCYEGATSSKGIHNMISPSEKWEDIIIDGCSAGYQTHYIDSKAYKVTVKNCGTLAGKYCWDGVGGTTASRKHYLVNSYLENWSSIEILGSNTEKFQTYTFNLKVKESGVSESYMQNVNATLYDKNGNSIFSLNTDSNGGMPEQEVDFRKWAYTGSNPVPVNAEYYPFTLTLTKSGFNTINLSMNYSIIEGRETNGIYLETAMTILTANVTPVNITVSLTSPDGDEFPQYQIIPFQFSIASSTPIANATLYTDEDGNWSSRVIDLSASAGSNQIDWNETYLGSFIWNVFACDDDDCIWGTNKTFSTVYDTQGVMSDLTVLPRGNETSIWIDYEYTNGTDVPYAICKVTGDIEGYVFYNSTSSRYENDYTTQTLGELTYTITCTKDGHETQAGSDTFTVFAEGLDERQLTCEGSDFHFMSMSGFGDDTLYWICTLDTNIDYKCFTQTYDTNQTGSKVVGALIQSYPKTRYLDNTAIDRFESDGQIIKVHFGSDNLKPDTDYVYRVQCYNNETFGTYESLVRAEFNDISQIGGYGVWFKTNIGYIIGGISLLVLLILLVNLIWGKVIN